MCQLHFNSRHSLRFAAHLSRGTPTGQIGGLRRNQSRGSSLPASRRRAADAIRWRSRLSRAASVCQTDVGKQESAGFGQKPLVFFLTWLDRRAPLMAFGRGGGGDLRAKPGNICARRWGRPTQKSNPRTTKKLALRTDFYPQILRSTPSLSRDPELTTDQRF